MKKAKIVIVGLGHHIDTLRKFAKISGIELIEV